jgi:hypothetical protein
LPLGRSLGAGIHVSNPNGDNIRITNTGVLTITGGFGITVSTNVATGEFQITNAAPVVNAFAQIQVNGDIIDRIQADTVSDVLNINSGQGITLTKDTVTDTLTITVDPRFDLKGSIFGDDSTKIVDAVENKVFAEFFGNLTGNVTGNVTGNASSATVSTTLDITNTNGLTTVFYPTFVENRTTGQTVRADVDLSYRTDTNTLTAPAFSGNLTGTVTGNIFTNLIDSADSSAITVTPAIIFSSDVTVQNDITAVRLFTSLIDSPDSSTITVTPITIFSSDVVVENDLSVTERLTVKGSRVLNLTDLKAVVAASSSFADFQTRIAALV